MKFFISLSIDASSIDDKTNRQKSDIVQELENELKVFLEKKDYGSDIEKYGIMLYIENLPFGYEHLSRNIKPKFTEYKLLKNKYTGEPIEIKKHFGYSIKIDGEMYFKFFNSSDEESKKILAAMIFNSFSYVDSLPKKVKDFDRERFKADMEQFFKERDLI